MMFTKKKGMKKVLAIALAASLSATMISTSLTSSALDLTTNGIYNANYATYNDALAAAKELNEQIAAEGDVLLKNDGTLPFFGNEKVTVFGMAQDNMVGGTGSITTSIKNAGFKVNPVMEAFYTSQGASIGNEKVSSFTAKQKASFSLYNAAAIVVLSRTGSEGNDPARVTSEAEDNKDADGNYYGWEHEQLGYAGKFVSPTGYEITDAETQMKHYLELTDSEEELISLAKANFKKVVVILNTSNIMEMANLEEDEAINAIMWVGRPGVNGVDAIGKLLKGEYNFSGKVVDEWNRDFTADPTWQNFGTNDQVGGGYDYLYAQSREGVSGIPQQAYSLGTISGEGFKGIDYDEGIYTGYRYFETVYAEIAAGNLHYNKVTHKVTTEAPEENEGTAEEYWEYAVVYPFGHGLSYTTFNQEFVSLYYKTDAGKVEVGATVPGSLFSSSVTDGEAEVKTLYAQVKVTNTGLTAGKEVVQIYTTAPYTAGGIEKAYVNLVGFGKTGMLRPGQSEVVTVEFNVQNMASFDYNDANNNDFFGYELEAGDYEVKVMADSHNVLDTWAFEITAGSTLELDDFSGNKIDNWFSKGDYYDTVRTYHDDSEGANVVNFNESAEGDQVLLTRTNLTYDAVHALAPTVASRTMSDEYVDSCMYFNNYTLNKNPEQFMDDADASAITGEEHLPWYKTDAELKAEMTGWTQAATAATTAPIQLKDMSGVDMKTTEGAAKWVEFMNQLTWADLVNINNHGSHTTAAIASIGKVKSKDENGPDSFCGMTWCDEPIVAATWNLDLCTEYGSITADLGKLYSSITEGWYGPGCNNHRSPFGGRNNEYYSQDGVQGGYIAAAIVGAAQKGGLNVYVKHIYMNDQEAARSKQCLFTWASEQTMREIYAVPFQMAMQEGGATSAMTAYNRIGGLISVYNDRFLNDYIRGEWGWEGEYVTDYYGNGQIAANCMDLLIRQGCDLPDGTASGVDGVSGSWKADAIGVGTTEAPSGNVVLGSGETAFESLTQWYYSRVCAQRVLYVAANTMNNRCGVSALSTAAVTVEGQQAVALSGATVGYTEEELNGNEVTYTATGLPAGVSVNASTGAITGTPSEVGTFKATVTATIAGWIKYNITVNFNIASAFTVTDSEGATITTVEGEAGQEVYAAVGSTVITPAKYNNGITYSATGLPAGVTMAQNGEITGTPTEVGTFNATVTVVASNKTGSGTRATTTNTTFTTTVKFVITGEPAPVVVPKAIVDTNVETIDGVTTYTITFDDGTTDTIVVTDGKDGANGADGAQGTAGAAGTNGTNGTNGVGVKTWETKTDDDGNTVITITLTDGSVQTVTIAPGSTVTAEGCNSMVGFGGIAALLMGACAVVALRKKED